MPPSTTLPVAGPWATCPLKYRKPPTSIAWENGPTGGASSGEVIAVLLMADSFGYWVGWSGWWSRGCARFQCLVGAGRSHITRRVHAQGTHDSRSATIGSHSVAS